MMTIKITTWSDDNVEITRLIETNGSQIITQNWHYLTFDEFWGIINKKFNTGDFPFETIGECPFDNNLTYDRWFLYVEFFNVWGDRASFVLTFGKIYIMQDGKTIESAFIEDPNRKFKLDQKKEPKI